MKFTVRTEYSRNLIWILDEKLQIGIHQQISKRKFHYHIKLMTTNEIQEPNRVETYNVPFGMVNLLIRWKTNRAFNKIKHRLIEWGCSKDVTYPWKKKGE